MFLLIMLTHSQVVALEFLGFAEHSDVQKVIVEVGGIPPLVALLSDGNNDLREKAAHTLDWLARNDKHKAHILRDGGIPALEALTEDKKASRRAKDHAHAALRRLPKDLAAAEAIAAADGKVPALVALVTSGSDSVKQLAAETLIKMMHENKKKPEKIRAAGGIPALVDMVSSSNHDAMEIAAQALHNLTYDNPKHQEALVASGCLPALLALVKAVNSDVETQFRRGLLGQMNQVLAQNIKHCEAFVRAGGVEALHAVCEDASLSEEGRSWALKFLEVLSKEQKPIGNVSVQEVEAEIRALDSGKKEQAKVAEELGNWAAVSEESRVAISKGGGAEALVALLVTGSDDAKWQAARALRNLCNNMEAKEAITKAGGVTTLEPLVRHGKGKLKEAADEALKLLSQTQSGSAPVGAKPVSTPTPKPIPEPTLAAGNDIPTGEGARVAMFSARFDGGPVEQMLRGFISYVSCFLVHSSKIQQLPPPNRIGAELMFFK